jgi:opacity protein-like surface antigen
MCDPVSIAAATLAVSAASTAATVYAQQQAADAQAKTNQRQYDAQMVAYNANQANANLMKTQEATATSQKKIENNAIARRDMARATVSAGESGVSGVSVDALLAELGGRAGTANANAEVNYLNRDRAIEVDRMNSWAGTASAINSLKTPVQPDYIGAGLRIADSGLSYQNRMNNIKAGRTT